MNELWQQKWCNLQQLIIAVFTYRNPHFCFPWRCPCDYHAICCMDGNKTQCVPNPSHHVRIYIYTMLNLMRKSKNRYFYQILVSPGDAPGVITLNVVWMERQIDAYKLSRSMYPPIFNSFPVIRTASAKNRHFHVPQPTFLFPWSSPCNYHIICCMDGKTIQCMPNSRSMYLSIFNSFRIIRCLSQCVSPKIVIFTTFLFPVETPLGQSR